MTGTAPVEALGPDLSLAIGAEYVALAELLRSSPVAVWDAPSLCARWRTREVVAHVTMPARYSEAEFMAELAEAGGDFTALSNVVAARDASLSPTRLLNDLCSPVLHAWQPPGGGAQGALTHCIIHELDIVEAVPFDRRIPEDRIRAVLDLLSAPDRPNPFGADLSGVRLVADDMEWSHGAGDRVCAPGQALVLVLSGRAMPSGRLRGAAAARFSRR